MNEPENPALADLPEALPDRLAERADVLAYLWRRRDQAAAVEEKIRGDAERLERAGDRRRQLEVIIGDIEGGLHLRDAPAEAGAEASAEVAASAAADATGSEEGTV